MIGKNFRRNITVKFLLYDYKNDLIKEFKLLLKDIDACFQVLVIGVYFVRIRETWGRCWGLYEVRREQRRLEESISQVNQNTLLKQKR